MDHAVACAVTFVLGVASGGVVVGFLMHFRSLAWANELERLRQTDAEKVAWLQQAQQNLGQSFEALASQSFRSNAEQFEGRINEQLTSHASHIGLIKSSLEGNLAQLDKYFRELERKREGAYRLMKCGGIGMSTWKPKRPPP